MADLGLCTATAHFLPITQGQQSVLPICIGLAVVFAAAVGGRYSRRRGHVSALVGCECAVRSSFAADRRPVEVGDRGRHENVVRVTAPQSNRGHDHGDGLQMQLYQLVC